MANPAADIIEPRTLTDHIITELHRTAAISRDVALAAAGRGIASAVYTGKLPSVTELATAYQRTAHASLAEHVATNLRSWSLGTIGDDASPRIADTAVDAWVVHTPGAGTDRWEGPQLRLAAQRVRHTVERLTDEWERGELAGSPGYVEPGTCPRCGSRAPEDHPVAPGLCPHPFHAATAAGVRVLRAAQR